MASAITRTALTQAQAGRVDRAREILAQDHGADTHSLTARIGQLEWHLGELVALVDQLTGQDG